MKVLTRHLANMFVFLLDGHEVGPQYSASTIRNRHITIDDSPYPLLHVRPTGPLP
jgi:hypothetical protein